MEKLSPWMVKVTHPMDETFVPGHQIDNDVAGRCLEMFGYFRRSRTIFHGWIVRNIRFSLTIDAEHGIAG